MLPDRWITDWNYDPRYPLLTRANAGEVLPNPVSPLGWSLVWMQGCLQGWRDAGIYDFVSMTEEELDPIFPASVGHHGGYLFLNGTATRIFAVRGPGLTVEAVDYVYFGEHPDVPPYVPEPWHENVERSEKMAAWIGGVVMTEDLPELRAERDEANGLRNARPDLTKLTDQHLVDYAQAAIPLVRKLFRRHLAVTAGSSVGPGIVAAVCAAMGDPTMSMRLLAGVGDVDSAAPSRAMWQLAQLPADSDAFAKGFAEFLVQFGSRGPNEWDIRSDVWETNPQMALVLIDKMRGTPDPTARNAERVADREALTAQVVSALASDPEAQGQFMVGQRSALVHLQGRERAKTNVIKVIHEIRMAYQELAKRHGYTMSEVCMLLDTELSDFAKAPDAMRTTLLEREAQYLELFDVEPPFIINGPPKPLREWPRKDHAARPQAKVGDVLSGVPGCPGEATGRARVVLDPSDPGALEPGDVLVAPLTDPAWTPLFIPAAAVIVDVGAQVSHAVIVSRELGIPCVVSVTNATRTIPDGALVHVNGTTGTVTVLEG